MKTLARASNYQLPNYPHNFSLRYQTPGEIISKVFTYAIPFAGILMLAMIIAGGYSLMLSGGEPEKVKAGKDKITAGIVGFLLVFTTWFIIRVIEIVFGIEILS